MMRGIFVTGTDTGIGKTLGSALLCSALRRNGLKAGYFKPVQTGSDDDVNTVRALASLEDEDLRQPVYSFPEPISPNRAAKKHRRTIAVSEIARAFEELPADRPWIIEGAGGILVPLASGVLFRDLAVALELPVVVVASTRLGTINHTLLTIEAIKSVGLDVSGIILNGPSDEGLREVLEEFSGCEILGEVPPLDRVGPESVAAIGAEIFSMSKLRRALMDHGGSNGS